MRTKVMVNKLSAACLILCCAAVSSCNETVQRGVASEYKTMEVALTDKSLTSSYTATITGRQCVEIRPQVSGVITKVCIEESASVRQGQALFVIDQVPYQAALQTALANVESAQAKLATAQLTLNSKQELYRESVVSDFDLQSAKNDFLMAQAALSQAKAQEVSARNDLSYTVVKSPVNGVTGMIAYRVGALVNSSIATPLVSVSDDKEVYVYFSMTENQMLSMSRKGGGLVGTSNVGLRLSDGMMYDQSGTIDAVSGLIDSSTGAVSVRATFPNAAKVLRSGGSGSVVIPYDIKGCIVIPQAATYELQDKVFAYRVVEGKAMSTPIAVFGINDGKEYVVESGLGVGDVIVAEGAGLLQDGVEVSVSKPL